MAGFTPPDDRPNVPPRPRKLTREIVDGIVMLIHQGNYRCVAAQRFGVSHRTFQRWMKLGLEYEARYPDSIYVALRRGVLEAEADAERSAVAQILAAGKVDVKHLEWWLERKYPRRYGRDRGRIMELERKIAELEKELRGALADTSPVEAD